MRPAFAILRCIPGIGIQHPGTFRGFVEENKVTKAMETGFSYLKSLGITHVQLMPVFDFGSVDEIYPRIFYNWGYDPVQYRVLEGSFSTDVLSPSARMREFGQLVEKCHENGIRVNLDVVFNHVYDKNTFSLENIVPNYYFLMNDQGDFSNGSWCGNDIDTSRHMSARYFVDTVRMDDAVLSHRRLRFDLMGILDIATINEIYLRCRASIRISWYMAKGGTCLRSCPKKSAPACRTMAACLLSRISRTVSAMW
ncbi:MAG: alpha-amylase family glycosyl hydrolase [Merdibacter sp.]